MAVRWTVSIVYVNTGPMVFVADEGASAGSLSRRLADGWEPFGFAYSIGGPSGYAVALRKREDN